MSEQTTTTTTETQVETQTGKPTETAAPAATATEKKTLWQQLTSAFGAKPKTEGEAKPGSETQTATEQGKPAAKPAKRPDRALFRAMGEVTARQEALAKREAQLAADEKLFSDLKAAREKLKTDPLGVLAGEGLDFEKLTAAALKGAPNAAQTEAQALRRELEELKAARKKDEEAQQNEKMSKAATEWKGKMRAAIDAKPDDYELIRKSDSYDRVWGLMAQVANETGGKRILSFDEAATHIEGLIENEHKNLSGAKKFAPKPPTTVETKPEEKPKTTGKPSPTLNNKLTQQTTNQPTQPATADDAFRQFRDTIRKDWSTRN